MNAVYLTDLGRCPDCDSRVGELRQTGDGVWELLVQHDDTCPQLKRADQR